jgi:hypothetical protein
MDFSFEILEFLDKTLLTNSMFTDFLNSVPIKQMVNPMSGESKQYSYYPVCLYIFQLYCVL